jgi:hypothetical protein
VHERALDGSEDGVDRSEMDSGGGLQRYPQSRRFTIETDEQAALVALP